MIYDKYAPRRIVSPEFFRMSFGMSIDTSDGHEAMDYPEHIKTYNWFLKGTVFLVVAVGVILFGMLIFLV